jgi:transposase
LLPSNAGRRDHPFGDDRTVVEEIVYRYRTGIPWHDLPREVFGRWQAAWKRHRRHPPDMGTRDRMLGRPLDEADATGKVDWRVCVDATGLDVDAGQGADVAERSLALARQWRALATRYDELATTYRAAVVLFACITWTRRQASRLPARASRARDRPR